MNAQVVSPELRQWIVDQARAGCRPEEVLAAMRSSGWDEDVAVDALESTLQGYLTEQTAQAALPPPVPVPEPDLTDSPTTLWAGDRLVNVLVSMRSPRVIVFGNLLSDAECEGLIDFARPRIARSETVVNETGASEVNAARTSDGMFFERGENPICARLEQRLSMLLKWPVSHGEGLQILRYRPGAEYKAHHDYFDPAQAGSATILKRGGQRVGTIVMYLNTPPRGGATSFPDVGLEVAAVKGQGVFFSYERPHVSTRTLHAGTPVLEGEKWVATKWLREGDFR